MAESVIDLTLDDSSDEEDPVVDVDEASRTQLRTAIDTVPESRLRQIMRKLVDADLEIERAVLMELVTVNKRSRAVMTRWEVCANCEEEFDLSEARDNEECIYHTGDLEVDIDEFADHDEGVHGPMDTDENRRSFPEGFYWNCCGSRGADHPGCEGGQHVPRAIGNKRRRL